MFNIYCTNQIYELNKFYIDLLLDKYNYIKKIIINDDYSLYSLNYIVNDINIYINNLNENILKILSEINKNIYLLNTSIISENDNISYINNYNVKIIDKSFLNISIFQKYKEILYLPCQINDELIFNDKINDIVVLNKDSIYIKNICTQINNEITDLSLINDINKFDILLKHKILLLFNNNDPLNEILCQYCIYNKILIINDKNLSIYKDFLKNYVIDIQYNLIPKFINYVLNNYNEIIENIYNNFNLEYIKNNIKDISDKTFDKIIKDNENDFGFIMMRHVNSEITGKYWIECYNCIRKYYKNKIIIIDDNSNYDYINNIELFNCEIIKSEFLKRGELLAYYYLYKYKFFKKAVIIHDSVFINKYINFNDFTDIKFIWYFTHDWDTELGELELINRINNKNIKDYYYEKDKWYGCFGLQTIIDYNFLEKIVIKYNIFKLFEYIDNRQIRMDFERIFGLICFYENKNLINEISLYGKIHHYIHWGYTYDNYISDKNNNKLDHLDIIKVWSGR